MRKVLRNKASSKDSCTYAPQDVFDAGIKNHYIANTAYPINHGQTINEYRVDDYNAKLKTLQTTRSGYDTLGLYVHIPFCEHRCAFCEYTVLRS